MSQCCLFKEANRERVEWDLNCAVSWEFGAGRPNSGYKSNLDLITKAYRTPCVDCPGNCLFMRLNRPSAVPTVGRNRPLAVNFINKTCFGACLRSLQPASMEAFVSSEFTTGFSTPVNPAALMLFIDVEFAATSNARASQARWFSSCRGFCLVLLNLSKITLSSARHVIIPADVARFLGGSHKITW